MTGIFDNHNHSQFSFDGKKTSVENSAKAAFAKGLGGICFSDHCDFYAPPLKLTFEDYEPEVFDVSLQQKEIDRVRAVMGQQDRPFEILKGIEIGMYEESHDEIRQILSEHSFDQVIASVHYIEQSDPYYGEFYDGKDHIAAYGKYLETIYREMTWMKDFDIMGHYDYIARYAPYPEATVRYRQFSDIFDEIFRYLIREGKALEINTKSYQENKGRITELDPDILKRYKELGGEIISLGSDSHDRERIGKDFARYAGILKAAGFRWTAHYSNRKLVQLPL